MKQTGGNGKINIWEYLLQVGIILPVIFIGFIFDAFYDRIYYSTVLQELALFSVLFAGIAGFWITRVRRQSAALLVWIIPFAWLIYTAFSLAASRNRAWADTSRVQYVWTSLFGPACSDEECIYTIPTDVFLASVAYSIGAYLALLRGRSNKSTVKS